MRLLRIAFAVGVLLSVGAGAVQQRPPAEIRSDIRTLLDEWERTDARVDVADSAGLTVALKTAPAIHLRAGTYAGAFAITRPLSITADPDAVILATSVIGLTIASDDVTLSGFSVVAAPGVYVNELISLQGPVQRVALTNLHVTGNGYTKRGVRLDGGNVAISRSAIKNIRRQGQDSQAIAGWNGTGPYLIEDNDLEAASEVIMFGGADPQIVDTIPGDIIIRGNRLGRPLDWCRQGWPVKNGIELKSARRVLIERNVLYGNCADAQEGFAFVFYPVNQEGTHVRPVVEDVEVVDNEIRDTWTAVQLNRPAGSVLRRITLRRNLFVLTSLGEPNRCLLFLGGMDGFVFEQNTIRGCLGSFVNGNDGNVTNGRFTGNLIRPASLYGIFTNGHAHGRLWGEFFIGGVISGNAIEGGSATNLPGNLILAAGDPDPAGYGR